MKKTFILLTTIALFCTFVLGSFAYSSPEESIMTARFYITDDFPQTESGNAFSMISQCGNLVIHVTDDTPIIFEDCLPIDNDGSDCTNQVRDLLFCRTLAEAIDGRMMRVTYGITTRSLPPQTNPVEIVILFEEATPS